jgi:hypothetical protein
MHSRAGFQAETAYVTFLGFLTGEKGCICTACPPLFFQNRALAVKNRPVKWAMGEGGYTGTPSVVVGGGGGFVMPASRMRQPWRRIEGTVEGERKGRESSL